MKRNFLEYSCNIQDIKKKIYQEKSSFSNELCGKTKIFTTNI